MVVPVMPEATVRWPEDGRRRVVVARVSPCVDSRRHAVKRTFGDRLRVDAALLIDGHDRLAGRVHAHLCGEPTWREIDLAPADPAGGDHFVAEVLLDRIGNWEYRIEGWVDRFATWRHGLARKVEARQDVTIELRGGAPLVAAAAALAQVAGNTADHAALEATASLLATGKDPAARVAAALDDTLVARMARYPDRGFSTLGGWIPLLVEPVRARFSSWYEMFPRSTVGPGEATRHGTLRDAIDRLPYVAELGFDVVYLPPIHPIGTSHRKGPDNSLTAEPGDPGSPWAIGGAAGGHDAIHPDLGTLDDFAAFVAAARELDLDIALDIAFQASPDHPWVTDHPGWFVRRSDGSIQHAENPPKKYQDVYPFDFECDDWRGLWAALAEVFVTWADRGVRVFRVDNPHTKPVPFWEWCLATVRAHQPEAIFLSEAFTRPLMLQELAKVGFSQSYTYFTWRTSGPELREYLESLTTGEVAEYLRPNFWPTTPDILPEHLQVGGRPASALRAVLAATLAASWGIYGPTFELGEVLGLPGREEFADSEKYQVRRWDLDAPTSLRHLIARLNQIRRAHAALQGDRTLRFHPTDDDSLLCYSKTAPAAFPGEPDDIILCVVNLDPFHTRRGWVDLDLAAVGIPPDGAFQVHDLLGGTRHLWRGPRNYIELDPRSAPAHVFALRRRVHREQGFEYFL